MNVRKLPADEKPVRIYRYIVTGFGAFPYDMLRYDCVWPATEADSAAIETSSLHRFSQDLKRGNVNVGLTSYREPTPARWESFGWSIVTD